MSKLQPRHFIKEQIANGDYDNVIYNIYVKKRIINIISTPKDKLKHRETYYYSGGNISILETYFHEKDYLPDDSLKDDLNKYYKSNQKLMNLVEKTRENIKNPDHYNSEILRNQNLELVVKINKIIDKERAKFCCSRMNWR